MDNGFVRLYIGPGFAYYRANAHGRNLKKKEINHRTQEEKGYPEAPQGQENGADEKSIRANRRQALKTIQIIAALSGTS
jgi:hypothetical protein